MSEAKSALEPRASSGEVRPDAILETHLAQVLRKLESRGETGVLEVQSATHRTGITVHDGVPVFADAGTVGETLGRVLLRQGRIDADEYAAILRRMTEALVDDELMRFGEVAVELGILDPIEVGEALAAQVREKIVRCLQLEQARWSWREDPAAAAHLARYPAPIGEVLPEAILSPGEAPLWLDRMERYGALYPQLRVDSRRSIPGITASRLRFLRSLDGTRSVAAVLLAASGQLEDGPALLAMLVLLGRAELRTTPVTRSIPPEPEPPPSPAPASDPEVRIAALRADLERHRRAPLAPPKAAEHRTRLGAEDSFEQGRRLLAQGRAAAAVPLLARACEAMPEAREYLLHQRFAEYLATDDATLRTAIVVDIEALVLEILRENRRCAFAHYVQGRLAAVAGDDARALRCFRVAVQLDPSDVEAQRWHRVLAARAR